MHSLAQRLRILVALCFITNLGCDQKEVAALRVENQRLTDENKSLHQQVVALSETEQNVWSKAMDALNTADGSGKVDNKAGQYQNAEGLLEGFIARYPKSGYIEKATEMLKSAQGRRAGIEAAIRILDAFKQALDAQDFKRAETLLRQMNGKVSEESVEEERQKLEDAKNRPLELTTKAFKLRYHDLVGRRVRFAGTLEASTYYNCGYRGPGQWRAFKFADDEDDLSIYCPKSEKACEQVFQSVVGGQSISVRVVVENSRRHYEDDNACVGMGQLVSADLQSP